MNQKIPASWEHGIVVFQGEARRVDEPIWPAYCGVRGEFSKYQEEYRVLGRMANWRLYVTAERYSQFRDKSYEENALEVSRALIGLYE